MIGGSGATLCLLLALLFASRQKNNRQLAYSAFPLALFNINEILVFGLPIVLNPILVIPFILTPIVSMLVAYGAVAIGWMPIVQQTVNWTTPVFFSGYLATGSWKGVVVQLISVVLGTMLYIPFVRLSERLQEGRENYLLGKLTEHFRMQEQEGKQQRYLERYDSLGVIAKSLTGTLHTDVTAGNVPVYYQPQVDVQGRVIGAEALLRWRFGEKLLYPPLVVELAQEDGCYEELTWSVLRTVCKDIQTMRPNLGDDFRISVNIVAEQLNDRGLMERVAALAEKEEVSQHLVLEVTEETLKELDAGHIPVIYVYNKADLCMPEIPRCTDNRIYMSAQDETCIRTLLTLVTDTLYAHRIETEFLIPYDKGGIVSELRENAEVLSQDYVENGVRLVVKCSEKEQSKFRMYISE